MAGINIAKMATGNVWSADEIKKLIESVKKNEVLWKVDHCDYGKRGPRFKALKKVASEIHGKGKFCFLLYCRTASLDLHLNTFPMMYSISNTNVSAKDYIIKLTVLIFR
jgi:hypothetical protein